MEIIVEKSFLAKGRRIFYNLIYKGSALMGFEITRYEWVRSLSFERGPFRFFYKAIYQAGPYDRFWKLDTFRSEGYEIIGYCPAFGDEKIELIKKFGRQAARAAHEESEKQMNVSLDPQD